MGQQVKRIYRAARFWPSRCDCNKLARQMDKCSPAQIREDIQYWSRQMKKSSDKWFDNAFLLPQSKRDKLKETFTVERHAETILEACRIVEGRLNLYPREFPQGITICITHHKRPDDLDRFLNSIPPDRYPVLTQDTGGNLSWGRNRLMARCETPYALICEEDMEWRHDTHIERLGEVLRHDPYVAFAAGRVIDGRNQWRHNFRVERRLNGWPDWRADISQDPWRATPDGTVYQRCDLTKNFGVVDVEFARKNPWDEDLPLSEHHDWFIRMHESRRAAFVPQVAIQHHTSRPSQEYIRDRKRAWPLYRKAQNKHQHFFPEPHIVGEHTNIVVLGVAHANTTITADQISVLGWDLGEVNTKLEQVRVVELNERLLDRKVWSAADARDAVSGMTQPWLIKDPRFAHTLRSWYEVFAEYEPLLVYVTKDQATVEQSWRNRGQPDDMVPELISNCEQYFDEWPWPKVKLSAEQIAKASLLFEGRYANTTNGQSVLSG